MSFRFLLLVLGIWALAGCQLSMANGQSPMGNGQSPMATGQPAMANGQSPMGNGQSPMGSPQSPTPFPPPPSSTPPPTTAPTPTPTPTLTPTLTPTPTAVPACAQRVPDDNLLTLVTHTYGLSRDYAPADLVNINDFLPYRVTQGYPLQLRQVALAPLVEMINDMEAAGLHPLVLSGYRSYSAQAIAWTKWNESHPDSAAIVSARPGHSEHQLGTAVDFGSPELPEIVGEEGIEFHTYFYRTSEGKWLRENAHRYGFTLSYPREAFEITGFYYEPWHFRYVGIELATELYESGLSFIEWKLAQGEVPCIP